MLSVERITVLDSAGFPWNLRGDIGWQLKYNVLKAYKEKKGNCNVPQAEPGLGAWVVAQRRQLKLLEQGKASYMTLERKHKLEDIGFVWALRCRTDWNERFDELVAYQKQFGDCLVPQRYSQNKALGSWTNKQREEYRLRLEISIAVRG